MRGVASLLALRSRGYVPDCVWIDTDAGSAICQADAWAETNNTQAHLHVEPGDRISRLDMRCVRGLPCYIDGTSEKAVGDMREACIEVGARRVIAAVLVRQDKAGAVAFKTVSVTDTDSVFDYDPECFNA